jgi:hypothetical protein
VGDASSDGDLTLAEKLDKASSWPGLGGSSTGFAGGAIVHGDVHPDQF